MYDTVKIQSPPLSEHTINAIMKYCTRNESRVCMSDYIIYEFVKGELQGSYDYRIGLKVLDYEWRYNGKCPQKHQVNYKYIEVECSLHKLMMGHNVSGGPQDIKLSIAYLVSFLENTINIKLPKYNTWHLERIDIAYCYDLKKLKNVIQFLDQLKNLKFPRRKSPATYPGSTGLYWSGTTDTFKMYAKGVEYKKHDYKRIKKYGYYLLDKIQTDEKNTDLRIQKKDIIKNLLQTNENMLKYSQGVLRMEIELHKKKLVDLFAENINYYNVNQFDVGFNYVRTGILIEKLSNDILEGYAMERIKKILNDVTYTKIINDTKGVNNKLTSDYGFRLGNTLYATWSKLATQGEEYTIQSMSKASYYRHIKLLRESNIGWQQTDIKVNKDYKIIDFNPTNFYKFMLDNLEIKGEDDLILRCYKKVS